MLGIAVGDGLGRAAHAGGAHFFRDRVRGPQDRSWGPRDRSRGPRDRSRGPPRRRSHFGSRIRNPLWLVRWDPGASPPQQPSRVRSRPSLLCIGVWLAMAVGVLDVEGSGAVVREDEPRVDSTSLCRLGKAGLAAVGVVEVPAVDI